MLRPSPHKHTPNKHCNLIHTLAITAKVCKWTLSWLWKLRTPFCHLLTHTQNICYKRLLQNIRGTNSGKVSARKIENWQRKLLTTSISRKLTATDCMQMLPIMQQLYYIFVWNFLAFNSDFGGPLIRCDIWRYRNVFLIMLTREFSVQILLPITVVVWYLCSVSLILFFFECSTVPYQTILLSVSSPF